MFALELSKVRTIYRQGGLTQRGHTKTLLNSIMWREVGNGLVAEMNVTLEGTESCGCERK